jgi:hypothetical protein
VGSFRAPAAPPGAAHGICHSDENDMTDLRNLIEEEVFSIGHSGEMPEVAYHTSLHYLQEDLGGPQIEIAPEDIDRLKDAVEKRYKRIVMRDLNPRYRDRSIYRGLARAMANWHRLVRFCEREKRAVAVHRQDAARALLAFLAVETADVAAGRKPSSANCSPSELAAFIETLGLAPSQLPDGWQLVCPEGSDRQLTP